MHLKDIAKQIMQAKHVLISAHTNPDGDAIGAMVAMGHFCARQNIPYTILLEEKPEKFSYLMEHVVTALAFTEEVDTVVALDCGNTARLVGYEDYFKKAKTTISIDHHITNEHYAQYECIEPNASSTSELVYHMVKGIEGSIDVEMGKALYTGMVTDTGGFMHSCTSPHTMQACAHLMGLGFDFSAIYHKLIHEKTLATLKLQGIAVNHLVEVKEGIHLSYLTREEMMSLGATKDDVDGIVSFLKNISGVQVVAFLYPLHKANGYKLSTRSNAPYDMAVFCSQFGGGGHVRAAGATLGDTLAEELKRVEDSLRQL